MADVDLGEGAELRSALAGHADAAGGEDRDEAEAARDRGDAAEIAARERLAAAEGHRGDAGRARGFEAGDDGLERGS